MKLMINQDYLKKKNLQLNWRTKVYITEELRNYVLNFCLNKLMITINNMFIVYEKSDNYNNYLSINNKVFVCSDCAGAMQFNKITDTISVPWKYETKKIDTEFDINNFDTCYETRQRIERFENSTNMVYIAEILNSYIYYIKYKYFYTGGVKWLMPVHVIFQYKNSLDGLKIILKNPYTCIEWKYIKTKVIIDKNFKGSINSTPKIVENLK